MLTPATSLDYVKRKLLGVPRTPCTLTLLRCGNASGVGQKADHFCHDVANAHYRHVLYVADLAWPTDEADGADEGAA